MVTKKINWKEIEKGCRNIVVQMKKHNYKPDVIIAISRGGTVVGTILSHLLNIDMAVVSCKRYNKKLGGNYKSNYKIAFHRNFMEDEKILLIDEIWDDGETICKTLAWLYKKLPNNEIRTAVLYTKSKKPKSYYYKKIKKETWKVFPWEMK